MGERLDAALGLDAAGATGPGQRLLRILFRGDRGAFEQALHERLVTHRSAAGEGAGPESLLPLGAIALSVLAVQVHGWGLHGDLCLSARLTPAGARPGCHPVLNYRWAVRRLASSRPRSAVRSARA
ncbi:Imm49 family immunity protein [Streptomyces sp. NBC_00006]